MSERDRRKLFALEVSVMAMTKLSISAFLAIRDMQRASGSPETLQVPKEIIDLKLQFDALNLQHKDFGDSFERKILGLVESGLNIE